MLLTRILAIRATAPRRAGHAQIPDDVRRKLVGASYYFNTYTDMGKMNIIVGTLGGTALLVMLNKWRKRRSVPAEAKVTNTKEDKILAHAKVESDHELGHFRGEQKYWDAIAEKNKSHH